MNLAEYFRLPQHQRLTRTAIAAGLRAKGYKITAAGVHYWVRHGVPKKWQQPLVEIISDQLREHAGSASVAISFSLSGSPVPGGCDAE